MLIQHSVASVICQLLLCAVQHMIASDRSELPSRNLLGPFSRQCMPNEHTERSEC